MVDHMDCSVSGLDDRSEQILLEVNNGHNHRYHTWRTDRRAGHDISGLKTPHVQ